MLLLTDTQRKVLEFIFMFSRTKGSAPTLREIAEYFSWKAVGSAQDIVTTLKRKGAILQQEHGKARQLTLTEAALSILEYGQGHIAETAHDAITKLRWIPMIGLVQAGAPQEAIAHDGEKIPFYSPSWSKETEEFFAVQVEGYSMVQAGFLPGDILLVERCQQAKNGQIVVAAVNNSEVTVKRFAAKGSDLYRQTLKKLPSDPLPPAYLLPENPVFSPIPFGLEPDARILGVVKSLSRPQVH